MTRARLVAALAGVAALGGCGSVTAGVDAAAQDATVEDVDAQPAVCPDAGYYITINGDGLPQTVSSSGAGEPISFFFQCCGYSALRTAGFQSLDGGVGLAMQKAASAAADGGLTFTSAPDIVGYYRADGTTFSSFDASLTTVYTELGPPGGIVAGSYAVTVSSSPQPDAASLSLSGTFFTCRTGNEVCACPPHP